MTKREFMNAVIALAEMNADTDVKANDFTMDQLVEQAKAEIESLDKRNATRSSKPTKKQVENGKIKWEIMEVLNMETPMIAAQIGEKVGISTQKASSLCTQLEKNEIVRSVEVKIPKKGTVKGYCLVKPETEETEEVEEKEE